MMQIDELSNQDQQFPTEEGQPFVLQSEVQFKDLPDLDVYATDRQYVILKKYYNRQVIYAIMNGYTNKIKYLLKFQIFCGQKQVIIGNKLILYIHKKQSFIVYDLITKKYQSHKHKMLTPQIVQAPYLCYFNQSNLLCLLQYQQNSSEMGITYYSYEEKEEETILHVKYQQSWSRTPQTFLKKQSIVQLDRSSKLAWKEYAKRSYLVKQHKFVIFKPFDQNQKRRVVSIQNFTAALEQKSTLNILMNKKKWREGKQYRFSQIIKCHFQLLCELNESILIVRPTFWKQSIKYCKASLFLLDIDTEALVKPSWSYKGRDLDFARISLIKVEALQDVIAFIETNMPQKPKWARIFYLHKHTQAILYLKQLSETKQYILQPIPKQSNVLLEQQRTHLMTKEQRQRFTTVKTFERKQVNIKHKYIRFNQPLKEVKEVKQDYIPKQPDSHGDLTKNETNLVQ